MKKLAAILVFCLSAILAEADTIYTATIVVTNLSGTTNGQYIQIGNGASPDKRTWTNAPASSPGTLILTDATQAGAAANMRLEVGAYPFSGCVQLPQLNGIRLQSNAWFSVTLSAGWATNLYTTNTTGPGILLHLPLTDLPSLPVRTNHANWMVEALAYASEPITTVISSTNPVFYGLLTVTNPATGNKATITNGTVTAVSFTATGVGTNQIGYSHFTNAANGYFLFQAADGIVTNSANAAPFTNLPIVTSFYVDASEMFTNWLGDGASLTRGQMGYITNAGPGPILQHTNGTGAVTNVIRFRKPPPWDWNAGTVKVGITPVCSGTNSQLATNCVFAVRAAAFNQGSDLSALTWSSLVRVTNNVGMGAWTNGTEGITAVLTIGGTPTASSGVLWEVQRHGGDSGDTETNADLFIAQLRVYYQSNTRTNFPTSSP